MTKVVHYAGQPEGSEDQIVGSLCGRTTAATTTQKDEVTCRSCLKKINAPQREDAPLKDLHLNVTREWFMDIKSGKKKFEYRLAKKWLHRLEGKQFGRILIKLGYPSKDDKTKILIRPWKGFTVQRIRHIHFGSDEVEVCAIVVND